MKTSLIYFGLFVLIVSTCKKDVDVPAPLIFDFTPEKGAYNIMVTIRGKNFDSLITNTSVLFNGNSGTVEFVTDTIIRARVPENATTGKITVTVNNRTATSSKDFIILPGKWRLIKSQIAAGYEIRHTQTSFVIGNNAYMGFGFNGGTSIKDLWEYDLSSNNWTRKADCGVDFDAGIAMIINNIAYVGFGMSRNIACCGLHKQVWAYDPNTNSWTRKSDFLGPGRWGPFGIGLNGKGYMGLGSVDGGTRLHDWWEYDPATDTWTQRADMPSTENHYIPAGFAINNKIYAGTTSYSLGIAKDWFEYDPATNVWTPKADFPGAVSFAASGFVIGNKGYIAGGGSECWEYDPSANSWTQVAFFDHRIGGTAFTLNNKGYYIGGSFFKNDQWEFTR